MGGGPVTTLSAQIDAVEVTIQGLEAQIAMHAAKRPQEMTRLAEYRRDTLRSVLKTLRWLDAHKDAVRRAAQEAGNADQ